MKNKNVLHDSCIHQHVSCECIHVEESIPRTAIDVSISTTGYKLVNYDNYAEADILFEFIMTNWQ